MKIIDSDDYSAAGIETMFFPGGEPHVKVPFFSEPLLLHLKLRTWNDVGFAALLLDALARQPQNMGANVFVPYFPGARQDRTDGRAALTVEVMANLLGRGHPMTFFDTHSDVTSRHMIRRGPVNELRPADLAIPRSLADYAGVIIPDHGAVARATAFRDRFIPDRPLIACAKKRDSQSGRLSGYEMSPLLRAGRYIIVDDICDGGGTFNLLAKAFREDPLAPRSSLELFVSHGIFSKGLDAIDSAIDHIITTDSWCRLSSNERLTIIPLLPYMLERLGVLHA